jgi:hypothetical protein
MIELTTYGHYKHRQRIRTKRDLVRLIFFRGLGDFYNAAHIDDILGYFYRKNRYQSEPYDKLRIHILEQLDGTEFQVFRIKTEGEWVYIE